MNKNSFYILVLVTLIPVFSGCIYVGTHGALKKYNYPVNRSNLQAAVENVISKNDNIEQPDTSQKAFIIDMTGGKADTLQLSNQYNDEDQYLSISIRSKKVFFNYTLRCVNLEDDSRHSILGLVYAYDERGCGGSEGNGGLPWYKFSLRKKLLSVFENELIENVDRELMIKRN